MPESWSNLRIELTKVVTKLVRKIDQQYRMKENNTLRKSLQTTSASPYRTQVQLAASFLVCSLIFIEYKPAAINQHPIQSKSLFNCQKCQHDSINDKELNGLGVDDFFHAKTSFSLETFPQRDMFVVKVRIVFS